MDKGKIKLLIYDFIEEICVIKKDLNKLYQELPSTFYTLKKLDYEKVFDEIQLATNGLSITGEDVTDLKNKLFEKFLMDYPQFNTDKSRKVLLEEIKKSVEYLNREKRQLKMYMVYVYTLLDELLLDILEQLGESEEKGIKSKIIKLKCNKFKYFPQLKLFNAERNGVIHAQGKYNKRNINLIKDKNLIEELKIYEGKDIELTKEKIIDYIEVSKEFIKFAENKILKEEKH